MPFSSSSRYAAAAGTLVAALLLSHMAHGRDFAEIQRGRYLADAGDCRACHTAEGGKPFAGGRPLETPFGTIYSANITPDRQTGIGAWSDADFARAMTKGIAPDGSRLYPAFPYPYFRHVAGQDLRAIRAYLETIDPVHQADHPNDLIWPLGHRSLLRGWNLLFLDKPGFKARTDKSADWNRGAYLVEGLGHCGACHTPKNMFGADKDSAALQGGLLQNWFAPNLTGSMRDGLGQWTDGDIVEYLKTGSNRHGSAVGPMAEVVNFTTSRLNDADLKAIAVYLKDLPGPEAASVDKPADAVMQAGAGIFSDQCQACHNEGGAGVAQLFAPLKGNANVQARDPTTVLRIILDGARAVATDAKPTGQAMPSFDWKLTDDQVAAVATYIRNAWGNAAPAVAAGDVKKLRNATRASAE